MDTLAHGLWGGAAFGQKKGLWKWAFFWGMAPDLFSFGPFFLTHIPLIIQRWGSHHRMEPPDPRIIPAYVYHAYDVTHSLVVWLLVASFVSLFSASKRSEERSSKLEDHNIRRLQIEDRSSSGSSLTNFELRSSIFDLLPFCAWPLHILCDIPTHSTQFFPTPYIWPFHTPYYNGHRWATPRFMLWNYGLILLSYLGIVLYKRSRSSKV